MRQECEDLKGRLAEQQAEYQRKLDRAKQDRDQEVEQLRDVHRYSASLNNSKLYFHSFADKAGV